MTKEDKDAIKALKFDDYPDNGMIFKAQEGEVLLKYFPDSDEVYGYLINVKDDEVKDKIGPVKPKQVKQLLKSNKQKIQQHCKIDTDKEFK